VSTFINNGVSFFIGLLSGLLTSPASKILNRWYHKFRASRRENFLLFRPEEIKFFSLNRWSPDRPLRESMVHVTFDDSDWTQDWCEPSELESLRGQMEDPGGLSASLREFRVDHRESESGQQFHMSFALSRYSDLIAVSEYFRRHLDQVDGVITRLSKEDTSRMIKSAPLSVVAINVTVTSADAKLLAIRRSGAVRTSQNLWTLGPNETMLEARPISGGTETPHELARRCLSEEIGIQSNQIKILEISWIGYNVGGALTHIVAHCQSTLASPDLSQCISSSHGSFEVDGLDWLPTSRKSISRIVESVRAEQMDRDGKLWLNSAALAGVEWARWQSKIGS
jgi:hypothetical protein